MFYENDIEIKLASGQVHYKGVKSNSVLNNLEHFHVCNPGLPPCIGHDMFEGVVQYDLMLIINYFIKKRYFTFDTLNGPLPLNLKIFSFGS